MVTCVSRQSLLKTQTQENRKIPVSLHLSITSERQMTKTQWEAGVTGLPDWRTQVDTSFSSQSNTFYKRCVDVAGTFWMKQLKCWGMLQETTTSTINPPDPSSLSSRLVEPELQVSRLTCPHMSCPLTSHLSSPLTWVVFAMVQFNKPLTWTLLLIRD